MNLITYRQSHHQVPTNGPFEDEDEVDITLQQPREKNSDRKIRNVFLDKVKSVTRGKVHVETEGRHRSLIVSERDPVIIINPCLEGSWFNLPKPSAPDTIGYWPRYTKFPGSSDVTHVPADERKLTPIKIFVLY